MASNNAADLPCVEKPDACFAAGKAPKNAQDVRKVGCVLGSFDPCHAGHEHMVRTLLGSHACEHVFLLVPATHFEKSSPSADDASSVSGR
jgi:hypothetical protein